MQALELMLAAKQVRVTFSVSEVSRAGESGMDCRDGFFRMVSDGFVVLADSLEDGARMTLVREAAITAIDEVVR